MDMEEEKQQHKSGTSYIAVGLMIGVVFGCVWDNMGLGIAFGLAIGSVLELRKKKKNNQDTK